MKSEIVVVIILLIIEVVIAQATPLLVVDQIDLLQEGRILIQKKKEAQLVPV